MTIQERAHIIAIARILGCTMTDVEIIGKYSEHYQEALKSLSKDAKIGEVEIFKRPF